MSVVLDASAILAFLKSEPGAEIVAERLHGATLSAVNLVEVIEQSRKSGSPAEKAIRLLHGYEVEFVAFDDEQAMMAASIRERIGKANVSLADRCCLALGAVRKLPVLTADRTWKSLAIDVEVIAIRGEPE